MKLTRRQVLAGAAAGAVGASGVYELVDRFAGAAPERSSSGGIFPEQHLLDGVQVIDHQGVEVLVPPLHHAVLTMRLQVERADLRDARMELERALDSLEQRYALLPRGLGVTVAWGLPYFRRLVPGAAQRLLPHDRRADKPALFDTRRFPSDPPETLLESNDVAFLLRSDSLANVDDAIRTIRAVDALKLTSIRRGFVGGGFDGGRSLPQQMAVAAGVPGADLIPLGSELFLGFTSTQRAGMGPGQIANFETLGYVDLRGSDYFRGGTHMHLSHIHEDLEAWYLNFDFRERVDTAFRPNLKVREDAQSVAQGPDRVSTERDVHHDFRASGRIGHSASIQTTSRLDQDRVAEDGTVYVKGTAIPIRADFNTLDNPFAWSARAGEVQDGAAAGVHFVVFNPSSDDFHRNRLAMDGVLPGSKIPFPPRARGQGFNAVLRTTHRQNFLVPPRRHRAFPLSELRA